MMTAQGMVAEWPRRGTGSVHDQPGPEGMRQYLQSYRLNWQWIDSNTRIEWLQPIMCACVRESRHGKT